MGLFSWLFASTRQSLKQVIVTRLSSTSAPSNVEFAIVLRNIVQNPPPAPSPEKKRILQELRAAFADDFSSFTPKFQCSSRSVASNSDTDVAESIIQGSSGFSVWWLTVSIEQGEKKDRYVVAFVYKE